MGVGMNTVDRCLSCHAPAHVNHKLGDACRVCRIEKTGTWPIVRWISLGNRAVEISTCVENCTATGFVGDNVSREFGMKAYANVKNAERAAIKWLEKHA